MYKYMYVRVMLIALLAVAEQNVAICELEEENVTIFPDQPINGSSFPPSECDSEGYKSRSI